MQADFVKNEQEKIREEIGYLTNFGRKANYSGILTTKAMSFVMRNYPEIAKGIMTVYEQMRLADGKEASEEDFVRKYLSWKTELGQMVTDREVKNLRKGLKNGKFSQQLRAVGTEHEPCVDYVDIGDENAERPDVNFYHTVLFADDATCEYGDSCDGDSIIKNKKITMAYYNALEKTLEHLYGELDFKKAVATELLLSAPFLDSILSGDGGENKNSYASYFEDVRKFALGFNPEERMKKFEESTKKFKVEWFKEKNPEDILDIDQTYLRELHKFSEKLLSGQYELNELYAILKNTIITRGKLYKVSGNKVEPYQISEKEKVSFGDIGGYKQHVSFYKNLIEKTRANDPLLNELRIVLSAGKPGLGKSMAVLAFLDQLPENSRGVLMGFTHFGSEFDLVRRMAALHPNLHIYAIAEDLDKVAGDRDQNPLAKEFLSIDSVDVDSFPSNLHMLATSNKIENFDTAIIRPGRTSKIMIYNPPDNAEREEIIRKHSANYGVELDSSIDAVVSKTKDLSGDELRQIFWALRFRGIDHPTDQDIEREVAEIREKWKFNKEVNGDHYG